MKSIGPYVVVREVTPGTANLNVASVQVARVSTFWATDRLTGMPVLLHSLPYVVPTPQIPSDPALLPFSDLILQEGQAYLVSELPLQARPAKDPVLAAHGALSALKVLHEHATIHGHIDLGQLWSIDGQVLLARAGLHVLREHLTPADDLRDLAAALDQLGGLPPILSVLRNAPDMLSAQEALDLLNTGLPPVSPASQPASQLGSATQVDASAWPAPATSATQADQASQPERPIPLFVRETPQPPASSLPEVKPPALADTASRPPTNLQTQPRSTITGLQNLRNGDRDPLTWDGGQALPQQGNFVWQATWSEGQEDAALTPPNPPTQGHTALPDKALADKAIPDHVAKPDELLPELKLTQFLDQFDQFVDPLPPVQPALVATEPELVPPELITSDTLGDSSKSVAHLNGALPTIQTPRRSQKAAASRALERLRAESHRQAALSEMRRDHSRSEIQPVKGKDDVVPGPSLNAEVLHARAENLVQASNSSETPQERRRRENEARREQAMLDAKAAAARKAERLREEAAQGEQGVSKSTIQIGFAGEELPQWTPGETGEEAGKTTQFQEVERVPESLRRPTIEETPIVEIPKKSARKAKVAEASRSLRPIRIGWDEDHSWRVVREGDTWRGGKSGSLLGYLAGLPGWVLPAAALLLLALCILVYRVARMPSAVTPAASCCSVQFNLGAGAAGKTVQLTLQQAPADAKLTAGQVLGTAPGLIQLPQPGTYQLGVSADGFRPASISVTAPVSEPITINLGP